jgi:transposase
MPGWRMSMRKIREILRLKYEQNLANRQIARSCNISRPCVAQYLARAEAAGLAWPMPEGLDDIALEQLLFQMPASGRPPGSSNARPEPDMPYIHKELRNKCVTLQLLWYEYKKDHPDGLQYSQFCDHYRRWARKLSVTMRQEHKAGDKLFIDYAGPTMEIIDAETGENKPAYLFVAVLGASNYTYVEAAYSQNLASWIGSHVRALNFMGGVPACLVPDNLKSGVTKACRYEPDINPTYQALASHYGTAVMPARPRRPRDKAKAEVGVQICERWIIAVLRHRTFFSLGELNAAIVELRDKLNHRKLRKLDTTRARLFDELDRPALRSLPSEPFTLLAIKRVRVNIDNHVDIDGHYYSAPYQLVHQELEAFISNSTIELVHKGRRIATHVRSFLPGRHTTLPEHRPKSHQKHLEWTPERITHWASTIGPSAATAVASIMESRTYPEQGYRSCLGLLRLEKTYSKERLEAACARAVYSRILSYKSIQSILKNGLDRQPLSPEPASTAHNVTHINVRGAGYYRSKEVTHVA